MTFYVVYVTAQRNDRKKKKEDVENGSTLIGKRDEKEFFFSFWFGVRE